MEFFHLSVRSLAIYLMMVATLGSVSNIAIALQSTNIFIKSPRPFKNFTSAISDSSNCYNSTENDVPISEYQDSVSNLLSSTWKVFIDQSIWLYDVSFPVTNTVIATHQDDSSQVQQPCSQNATVEIPLPALLLTMLSSYYLLRGTLQMDYSYCQFWYYVQVGSILACCLKIAIVAWLSLWNAVTNTILIAVLFALIQLCIVQKFMENLNRRLMENTQQNKFQRNSSKVLLPMKNADSKTYRFVYCEDR